MTPHPHFLWTDLFRTVKPCKINPLNTFLNKNILFKSLTPRELAYVSSLVYERVYQPGESVFKQDDRGLGMYMIAKGRVAIKSQSIEGDTHITTLGEDSFFGEIALVEPESLRSASATAVERSVILGFFKPDLLTILDRNPAIGVKILFQLSGVLSRRLIETTEKVTQLLNKENRPGTHAKVE